VEAIGGWLPTKRERFQSGVRHSEIIPSASASLPSVSSRPLLTTGITGYQRNSNMDPMTALNVATSVVQFVEFAGTIFSSTWSIYRAFNRDRSRYSDLETITRGLRDLNKDLVESLKWNPSHSTDRDRQMIDLCGDCNRTALELIQALEHLRAQAKSSVWGSFRIALSSVLGQDKVAEMQNRLEGFRHQMTMFLLVSVRYSLFLK
jgi:hypothetical protein